jgi:hypothetical protein
MSKDYYSNVSDVVCGSFNVVSVLLRVNKERTLKMLDIVEKSIDRFYLQKDYTAFKKLCEQSFPLFEEIKKYVNRKKLTLSEGEDYKDSPSRCWAIHFDDYKKGDFEVAYKTILKVSKVAPLYYVQHEFAIKHNNKDCTVPVLYGVGLHTKKQFALLHEIFGSLKKKGYCGLELSDMNEVVEGIDVPEGVKFFRSNITVDHLLFIDILNICSK